VMVIQIAVDAFRLLRRSRLGAGVAARRRPSRSETS
jgi:hypothetical protein